MDQRELVAQGRLCDAKWEYDLHVGTGRPTNGKHYQDLIRNIELAELRLRAVLGNIAQRESVSFEA
jgi:hypothetical protein